MRIGNFNYRKCVERQKKGRECSPKQHHIREQLTDRKAAGGWWIDRCLMRKNGTRRDRKQSN